MLLKIAYLTFLYFIQGLPYGLQDKVLPLYLRERGLSYTQLTLARFLLVPWLCKAFYAPIIDRWLSKHSWLCLSLLALALTSCSGSLAVTQTLGGLSIMLLLLNTFSGVQDVSVDAIAINGLKESELGLANTAQVVGYKIGAICGGSFLFWLQVRLGLGGMFLSLGGIYLCALTFLVWFRPSMTQKNKEKGDAVSLTLFWNNMVSSKDTWEVIFFVVFYKMGEGGALSLLPLFLIDQGVSKHSVMFWTALVGQGLSLAGSAVGGACISSYWSSQQVLHVSCALRLFPMVLQTLLVATWSAVSSTAFNYYFKVFCLGTLCLLQLVGGAVTTSTFSLMMLCSQKQTESLRATHYSFLASVEVLGKLIFASSLGSLVDMVGFPLVFILLLLLTALSLAIVPVSKASVREHVD